MAKEKKSPSVKAKTTTKKAAPKKSTKATPKKNTSVKKTEVKKIEKEEIKKEDELDVVKVDLSSERKDEYYDILEHEKSHFFLKFLITILIIALGVFIIYKFVIRDQKAIFTAGINTIYEKLANNMIKISNIDLFKDNIEIDGVLSINTTDKNYTDLNNYLYEINLGINRSKNNYKLAANLKENDQLLTSFNYYYMNDNYYLNLGNNYDKTLKLKNNVIDFDPSYIPYTNINYNRLNECAKSIKNTINSNIKRNKLVKGEETINNETYEYVALNLSKAEYSDIVSNVLDNVKNNNYLVNNLSQAFNTDSDKILSVIDELQLQNLNIDFNNITFKFYTYGFMANIAGFEIDVDDNQVLYYFNHDSKNDNQCDNCIRQTYKVMLNIKEYNIYIDKNGNVYNAIIRKDNQDYLHLVFNEYNENTIDVDYENYEKNIHGNVHLDFYNKNDNKSGNFKYSTIDKKNTTSLNFDYRVNNNANINISTSIVNIDDLPEDDYIEIGNNISKNIKNNVIRKNYKDTFERIYNY